MTDQESFLEEIRLHPEDDTVRLVYADWLDENTNDPGVMSARAAFIRTQIEVAEVRMSCGCGSCVNWRGAGGQHHNGPCALDKRDDDGNKRFLRQKEQELFAAGGYGKYELPKKIIAALSPDYFGRLDNHDIVVYKRGFVDRVEIRCNKFVGESCACLDWARADGDDQTTWGHPSCKECGATGRIPGLAAAIFRHPVREIHLTDRAPFCPSGLGLWYDERIMTDTGNIDPHPPSNLPPCLFDLLSGRRTQPNPGEMVYESKTAAAKALSDACVLYGKKEFAKSRM